ncbi:hypothetical protein D3C73_1004320 [compost metagenome]
MIGMGVADQHQVEALHPQFAQRRQHDTLPLVKLTESRSGVIQQGVMPGAHQNSQPLPHIQLPDFSDAFRQH